MSARASRHPTKAAPTSALALPSATARATASAVIGRAVRPVPDRAADPVGQHELDQGQAPRSAAAMYHWNGGSDS